MSAHAVGPEMPVGTAVAGIRPLTTLACEPPELLGRHSFGPEGGPILWRKSLREEKEYIRSRKLSDSCYVELRSCRMAAFARPIETDLVFINIAQESKLGRAKCLTGFQYTLIDSRPTCVHSVQSTTMQLEQVGRGCAEPPNLRSRPRAVLDADAGDDGFLVDIDPTTPRMQHFDGSSHTSCAGECHKYASLPGVFCNATPPARAEG